MALTGDLTKDAILAMEQVYLPRILALEVAVLTCVGFMEDYVETVEDEDIKRLASAHLDLVVGELNNKEYLNRVFDENMKNKLNSVRVDKENK